MATKIDNLSYTNKDFNAIFEELLAMGDELSAKWKPSATNESDPGIVLIKENAVIGDKLDYNIDKNILEAFPSSVTQEGVARQLFEEQLACPAQWYKAASGIVNFRYVASGLEDPNLKDSRATIPMYTIVQNSDATISYTIIDNDKSLSFDGTYNEVGYNILQGTPNDFTIGINNIISINNLDDNRRLYFQEYNVAQNGIFVSTTNDRYNFWKVVELLSVQTYGDKVVKFGVDKNNRCYLEFPTWIEDIIGDGLYVTYITTDGVDGGVASNQITQFGADITLTPYNPQYGELEDITLNADNVLMQNPCAINNGKNPDTIDEMFDRYKRLAGTFNTLVTINDYESALPRDIVGNGFACDRTNDIQSSYNIVQSSDNKTRRIHKREQIEVDGEEVDMVSPYDVKLYLTQLPNVIQTTEAYKKSFNFVDNFGEETFDDGEHFNASKSNLIDYVVDDYEENKCISQDFTTLNRYKPLFFKNKYPINCTIIPVSKLSEKELAEVKRNVVLALYDKYNGSKMHFGEEIDYDDVYDTIKGADERIASIHLQDIEYKTYAVYRGSDIQNGVVDEDKYIEVDVNSFFEPMWNSYSTEEAKEDGGKIYVGEYDESNLEFTFIDGTVITSIEGINEIVNLGSDSARNKYIGCKALPSPSKLLPINNYNGVITYNGDDEVSHRYPWGTEFATDIFAKSVLNGNTPFVNKDTTFERSIAQSVDNVCNDAYYITTNAKIYHDTTDCYVVDKNENIQIFSPSYRDALTFPYGAKVQFIVGHNIPANTDYRLTSDDQIIIYWRGESEEDYQWMYFTGNGVAPEDAPVLRSSMTLKSENNAQVVYDDVSHIDNVEVNMSIKGGPWLGDILPMGSISNGIAQGTTRNITLEFPSTSLYPIMKLSGTTYNEGNSGATEKSITTATKMLEKLFIMSFDAISIKDSITKRELVEIKLDNQFMYFWVLNKFIPASRNEYPSGYKSVLFAENQGEYTLDNDEYLFYTNRDGTAVYQLGAGTKLTRDVLSWSSEWACDRVDLIDYMQQTAEERSQYWKSLTSVSFIAQEQTISSFGEGTKVWISQNSENPPVVEYIYNEATPLESPSVSYQLPNETDIKNLSLPSTGVSAKTALQLVCTQSEAQELTKRSGVNEQYVYVSRNINQPDAQSLTLEDCFVLASRDCEYSGIAVNVQTIDVSNERHPLQLYSFEKSTAEIDSVDADYEINNYGGINFDIPSTATTYSLSTSMESGNYLLPFKFSGATSMSISIGGDAVQDISGDETFYPNRQYYLSLSLDENTSLTIDFEPTSTVVTRCITKGLIKYTMTDALAGDAGDGRSAEWHLVLQRMRELDKDNQFDYGYEVKTSDLIENPIEAIQFNNPKHIMNRFTICEMNIDAMGSNLDSIKILNSAR